MSAETIKNNRLVSEHIRRAELAPGETTNNLTSIARGRVLRSSIVSISGTIGLRDAFSLSEYVIFGANREASYKKYSPEWRAKRIRRNRNQRDKRERVERVSRCLLAGHDAASCYKRSRCHLLRGSRLIFATRSRSKNNKRREGSRLMPVLKLNKENKELVKLPVQQQEKTAA